MNASYRPWLSRNETFGKQRKGTAGSSHDGSIAEERQ